MTCVHVHIENTNQALVPPKKKNVTTMGMLRVAIPAVVVVVAGQHPTAVEVLMNTGTMGTVCVCVRIRKCAPGNDTTSVQQRQQRGGVTSSYPGGV